MTLRLPNTRTATRDGNPLTGADLSTIEPMESSGGAVAVRGTDPLAALVALVVQRLALGQDVAMAKFASGQPVDDPIREAKILDKVAGALNSTGHFQEIGMQFFRDQIEANKVIQRGLHKHWHAHPEELPVVPPDLAAEVRPRLDHITRQMLWLFTSMDTVPQLRRNDIEDLLARSPGAKSLRCLHRDAVALALRSLVLRSWSDQRLTVTMY